MTCYVYRHYSSSDELLYVGISLCALVRLSQHRQSEWFDQIARVQIEKYSTREYAQFVEALEIEHCKPKYNKVQPYYDLCCPEMAAVGIREARAELWVKAFDPSHDAAYVESGLLACSNVEQDNIIERGIREARRQKEQKK